MRAMLLTCFAATAAAQTTSVGTLEALYDAQTKKNPSLVATTVLTALKGKTQLSNSRAFGARSSTTSAASAEMALDTEVRIGSMAEMLVVAAALTVPEIAQTPNAQIPTEYLPNKVDEVISYQSLMQHTSGLIDPQGTASDYNSKLEEPQCNWVTGECVDNSFGQADWFATWMKNTFAVTTAGKLSRTLRDPEQTGEYRFAHLNTALLAYVLDQMVIQMEITVKNSAKGVAALIYEAVIQPLGMSNTFYQDLRTIVPLRGNEALSATLSSMLYEYEGSKQITMTHPNGYADVMLFSNTFDIMRFANGLLATKEGACVASSATLCGVGQMMRDKVFRVQALGQNTRSFHIQQSLGIQYFSPSVICAELTSSGVFEKCPLDDTDSVWGYITGGEGRGTDRTTIAAVLCTDASGLTEHPSCTVVLQGHKKQLNAGALDPKSAVAMAAAAMQVTFGDTPVATSVGSDSNDLYGLWVGFGVFGTIIFVIAASYLTEFLIQPPPMVGPGMVNPTAAPGAPTAAIPGPR
eukprot:TRINITY_DN9972_c0_g1_i1.p2 TRINITY_DN9972_c0_g1~~TRINITY_DN9972_c0_g1_i1.p2  ORF type:complete len:522 (+),score=194.27 TRINITY_DN9972_c0_g1_i1:66-1631(+)